MPPKPAGALKQARLIALGYRFAPVRNRTLPGRDVREEPHVPKLGNFGNWPVSTRFPEFPHAHDAGGTRNDGRRIPVHAFTPVMSRFRTHFQTKADLGNWQPSKINELPRQLRQL